MDESKAKRSPEAMQNLIEQLRAENRALREDNSTLRDQLASVEAERSHLQAELSALTNASQVVREDRDQLQSKVDELQATVDRLTDMVWGRRSEKRRCAEGQLTLFSLEELAEKREEIITADEVLDEAAERELLAQLLARRKRRKQQRFEERGRENFPAPNAISLMRWSITCHQPIARCSDTRPHGGHCSDDGEAASR